MELRAWYLASVYSPCYHPLFNHHPITMKKERTNFEKLMVYRLSEKLADDLWKITRSWKSFDRSTVGQQIVRSADSIGANIAEGTGRGTVLDNRRFVLMARGSLYETKHWLRRAHRRGLLEQEQTLSLRDLIDQLTPMLNAYLSSLKRRSG